MERNVIVKNARHHQTAGLIEMEAYVEERDGEDVVYGALQVHSIDAISLEHGWEGNLDHWLAWVKEQHMQRHTVTTEMAERLNNLKGKAL